MTTIPAYGKDIRKQIKPRIPRGPVNRTMVMAGAFGALAYATWPDLGADGLDYGFPGISALLAAKLVRQGIGHLLRDYRIRRGVAISTIVSKDHGSARQSTKAERIKRGMHTHEHGELFGLDDEGNPVWRPPNAFLALVVMPPGAGKTSRLVMNSVCHRAMLGYSLIVPDVKAELAVMMARQLRALGKEVWCINLSGQHVDLTGNIEVGLYQPIIDAVYGDAGQRKQAFKLAADYAALHHPMTNEEKNPYFGFGSRRVIIVAILISAHLDPADCTPTAVYRLLTDPVLFLKLCRQMQKFQTVNKDDRVLEDLKRECRNLLHRADKNEENFASFLEGASQKFLTFSPSGVLGDYGAGAIHSLSAIRDRQIIVFIITPLSAIREYADVISLINHNMIAAVKAKPDGHPVHIVGEEALNYRFHDLVSDLETLRQYGVTIDLYVQSRAGLERHYGKAATAAIEAYADIRIFGSLNDHDEAKRVSAMLSETTVRRQDISYQDSVKDLGIATREMGRPLMKPNEVLAMPKNQAWMFVNGLHPVRLTQLSYAQVSPWRDWIDPSPITGTRLHAEPVLHVDYAAKGDA